MIYLTIKGELYSKKNSKRIVFNRRTKKPFVISSAKSNSVETGTILQLNARRMQWNSMIAGRELPLRIQFKIYRATRRRFDYVNIVQGLCDLMVKAHWIEDDSADYMIPVFVPYDIDAVNPRTEISIL